MSSHTRNGLTRAPVPEQRGPQSMCLTSIQTLILSEFRIMTDTKSNVPVLFYQKNTQSQTHWKNVGLCIAWCISVLRICIHRYPFSFSLENSECEHSYSSERRTANVTAIIRPFCVGFCLFVYFEFSVTLLFVLLLGFWVFVFWKEEYPNYLNHGWNFQAIWKKSLVGLQVAFTRLPHTNLYRYLLCLIN